MKNNMIPRAIALAIIACFYFASAVEAQYFRQPEDVPSYIVPPDQDPSSLLPAHWGLVKKGAQPGQIPSLEQNAIQYSLQPGQYADPYTDSNADPNVVPRLPFLQMTAEEAAYQPSPFHVKPESPTLKEVMTTGAWFASYESMFLQPHFQGNTGLTVDSATSGITRDYDFGFQHGSAVHFGFESKKGPGAIMKYWELNADSDLLAATSDGTNTVTNSIWLMGPRRHSLLQTSNAGETVTTQHKQWITSLEAMLFKEIKMPISRLNGTLGFRYIQLHHEMQSELTDAGGGQLGALNGTHYFRGLGPKIGFEYYRPIGHSHIEFIGSMNTTLLFGNRDQVVSNTQSADFSNFAANEILSVTEARVGAQWIREWGQRYRFFIRGTVNAQIWYGGGTAADPFRDFGLYGVTLGAGLNH